MDQAMIEQQGYMKGKSKHLFWVVLALLLLSVALEYLQAPLLPVIGRLADSKALPVVLAVVKTLVINGGWFVVLLMYALACNIKTYKVVFIVLAVMQFPAAAGAFISNLYTMRMMTGRGGNGYEIILLLDVASTLSIIVRAAWVACLAVIVFSKWSGALLRVAAATFSALSLLFIVNALTAQDLYRFLIEQFDHGVNIAIISTISILLNVLYLVASGFFFGAMSFGKQRKPKALQAAVEAAQ